jgi:transcription elongation factor GreB
VLLFSPPECVAELLVRERRIRCGMSKAFTREDDDLPERHVIVERVSSLPAGASNYITSDGAERLRAQLEQLLATTPRDETNDGRAQQRIYDLQQILQSAVVVLPPAEHDGRVRFGARVTVRNPSGETSTYRIVGVDETNFDPDAVSWLSPIARALMNASVGQRVQFEIPSGEEELEILSVDF